ncbi:MAG: hypothetical protein WCR31_01385 [Treponema sp.]
MTFSFLPAAEDDILTRGRKIGFTGTVVFWFVFTIVSVFMPVFRKKPEYKTVRITLASVPVEKAVKTSEPERVSSLPPEQSDKPARVKKTESENKSEQQKKTATVKKTSTIPKQEKVHTSAAEIKSPPEKPSVVYKKSVEELMAEQRVQKEKNVQWDDSLFGDASVTSNTAQSAPHSKQIAGAAALSGTSAEASQQNTGPVNSTAASESKKPEKVDVSTKATLGAISATTYTQSAGNGVKSQTSVKTGRSSDGKVAVEMADGSARILLYPAKPSIQISDENAKLIDSRRTVTVQFKVLAKGNVPLSAINITPASILPLSIQQEIREQVSMWRFVQDAADGYANFIFTIDFKK